MKKTSKIILWGIVIILVLVAGGGFFWYWKKKSKNQNDELEEIDDSPVSQDESEIDEMGYCNYVPPFDPNASETQAKKEVLKTLCKTYGGKGITPRKAGKILLEVNAAMEEKDQKLSEKTSILDLTHQQLEEIATKCWKEDFLSNPDQNKFEQVAENTRNRFFTSYWWFSFLSARKSKDKIDWKKAFYLLSKKLITKHKERTHAQLETDYRTLKNEVGRVNNFLCAHAQKFPRLNTLAELNQWVKAMVLKTNLGAYFLWKRYTVAKEIGKKSFGGESFFAPEEENTFKNPKFNLTYRLKGFYVRDNK